MTDGFVEHVGRFRVVGCIARGGMAEIFLARPDDPESTDAGAEVALKRLLPGLAHDRGFLEMFRDEAHLASQLDHPNIVRILEVGEDPNGPHIAMELLRGVNLRDLLSRLQTLRQSMPLPLGIAICVQALSALGHAHRFADGQGRPLRLVHRDVSPQNVILTYDGAVKLVDFGVAKAEGRLHQTRAGLIKGKFAYMSPEQVDAGELDGRSDLFALAEVFFELLLRRHPFYAASDMDVLRKVLDEPAPDARVLDPSFPDVPAEVLHRALEKRPEDRFPDAESMRAPLDAWLREVGQRPTSRDLARFVRSLFGDRLREEERARRAGDDRALVEALRVGRASVVGMVTQMGAPVVPTALDGSEDVPTVIAGGRPPRPRPHSVTVRPASPGRRGPRIVPAERADAADPAEAPAPPEPLEVAPLEPTSRRPRPFSAPRRFDLAVFALGLLALLASIRFALAPPRGTADIDVHSEPPGAEVWVNRQRSGLTSPARLRIPTGEPVDVELRHPGFRTCTKRVLLGSDVPADIRCRLEPLPHPAPRFP